jgi:hypothetical protein
MDILQKSQWLPKNFNSNLRPHATKPGSFTLSVCVPLTLDNFFKHITLLFFYVDETDAALLRKPLCKLEVSDDRNLANASCCKWQMVPSKTSCHRHQEKILDAHIPELFVCFCFPYI